jgi:outer membrane protein assembly factor BamB
MTIKTLALALLTLAFALPAWAQEWPQWRGPGRDGHAPSPLAGESWPAALDKEWSVEVGSGHSSPLVSGDRIYLFTRREEAETLTALSLDSGQVLWRTSYEAPYRMSPAAAGHGKGPKSTPVLAGGRIFTLGISGILSAFDAAGGKTIWRRGFDDRFGATSPSFGASMSPIVDGERLFAHVGGGGDGALVALDVASGEELWSWTGDGPGYASPLIAELSGVRQLITQVETAVVGLDVESGRLLWSVPFETPWVQNIVTPVVDDGLLIYSGLDQGITAVRPHRSEGGWILEEVWSTDAASLYMSSPVVVGDRLCGFSHLRKGQHFCSSLADGGLLWAAAGKGGDNAAVLTAGGWVFALTDGAELVVYRADAEAFAPVASYQVADSATWAHPVILPGRVLIKDKTGLTLYRLP